MRRKFAVLGLAGAIIGGGFTLAVLPSEPSLAEPASQTATFVVPVNDGYGVGECVGSGSGCGQVVADQWCSAQGFVRSVSFEVTDPADVTGSIAAPQPAPRPISITCGR